MKKLIVILFLLTLISSISSASSSHHSCSREWVNTDEESDYVVEPIEPIELVEPINNSSETTTFDLCKDNVCTLGGNGRVLTLTNYANAKNPTYDQLIAFAKEDHTETFDYSDNFVCSDFAAMFHNNAEKAGIKAGWVGVRSINHAFNVFETTDKGIVYIDCTASSNGEADIDKQVFMEDGQEINSKYLFKDYGTIDYGAAPFGITLYW